MGSRVVRHDPQWQPTRLRYNAAGDTKPGFVCVHPMENGNGRCGANVFSLADMIGDCSCVVDDDAEGTEVGLGDVAYQVSQRLFDTDVEDYDLTALVKEIVHRYGFVDIDTIPASDYWALIQQFNRTQA